ncbi:MAG TPA: nitroreductase family deazaflavin-dependent oxidoreductase [bacterium]|nr:nitroreductase family deazaflavin-dependent oxidoreductase [bacterium]
MRRILIALATLPVAVMSAMLVIRFNRRRVAGFNRVVLNRITRPFAGRAPGFAVVIHHGRTSGRLYRTPVNIFRVPGGYVIALTYGAESEWVKNVLAAGECTVEMHGELFRLVDPVVVRDPGPLSLPPVLVRVITGVGGVTEYLRLCVDSGASPAVA